MPRQFYQRCQVYQECFLQSEQTYIQIWRGAQFSLGLRIKLLDIAIQVFQYLLRFISQNIYRQMHTYRKNELFCSIILFMQDKKILNQFAAKISKAKILYDSTSFNCQKLRREAAQLQREYEQIKSQRQSAEAMEKSLKAQLSNTKQLNKQQNQKFNKQTNHLNDLRKNKKQLKRQKDSIENDLLKNTLTLEELIQQREKLQAHAKALSDRLEGVTAQKDVLIDEYNKTSIAIQKYNKNIQNLRAQIEDMRTVITSNTVPVNTVEQGNKRH